MSSEKTRERENATPADEGAEAGRVRLSPVELRNLELINDPALGGFAREGRKPFGVVSRVGNAAAAVADAASGQPSAGSAEPAERVDALAGAVSPDGLALYSADGAVLLKLAASCERYEVLEGCLEIAAHAFDSAASLQQVTFPSTLKAIGRLAFAKSGLCAVHVPSSVEVIGEKAFFCCARLAACSFAPGVREIGAEAFAHTGVVRVSLPSTLERLGAGAFANTPAQRHASTGCLSVDERNRLLEIDAQGGLYEHDELVEYLGCDGAYEVREGTRSIRENAFRHNAHLARVSVPEGVRDIGAEAFRGCRNLQHVGLPDSLERIGARAFANTRIRELCLSRNVREIGEAALLVQGESPQHSARPLARLVLDPGNPSFYIESGLLCARGAGHAGGDACLLYVGPDNVVRIPQAVNRLMPHAMSGACGIDELHVHAHLHSICRDALTTLERISHIHVEFPYPIDGYDSEDFLVPSFSARFRVVTNLIDADARGTTFNFAYYDAWVSNATDFEEFALAAVRRLMHPIRLSDRARELYRGIFSRKQVAACRLLARKADIDALAMLCDAGVLEREAVDEALGETTGEGAAQATACLLELKRRRAWDMRIDMSL